MNYARICAVFLAVLLATAYFTGAAQAAPADPNVVVQVKQPDGTVLSLKLWGDEYYHGHETLDGYTVVKDKNDKTYKYGVLNAAGDVVPSGVTVGKGRPFGNTHVRPTASAINNARALRGAPALGSPTLASAPPWAGSDTDVLFIMVGFTDRACTFTAAQMQANLFGLTATGPGNLATYFAEISYGKLQLAGTVVGCYTLSNTHAFYDTGGGSAAGLVTEAVNLADAAGVDFAPFDNDGDGKVDTLGVIYAGGGPHDGCDTDNGVSGSAGDNLWPHQSDPGTLATVDGKTVSRYILNSELTYAIGAPPPGTACAQIQSIGLFAHEMGHGLGLPDLYDTDQTSEGGVGNWSAMASQYTSTVTNADTPGHYDPWSKWFEGWITPDDKTGQNTSVSLDRVEDTGKVLQFLANPGGVGYGGGNTGEYFPVENRGQVKFNSKNPSCGILIWHIDEAKGDNTQDPSGSPIGANHRLVNLVQADNLGNLDVLKSSTSNNRGDAGDPYPGSTINRLFSDTSVPNANLYGGAGSGVRVGVPGNCAPSMSLNLGLPVADLSISKFDNPDPVIAGNQLQYDIYVYNSGPGAAPNAVVTDVLPAGVTFLSSSSACTNTAGTLTCNLGTLAANTSTLLSIQVRVNANLLSGLGASTTNISNTASIAAGVADGNLSNNSVTISTNVIEQADLKVSKTCEPNDQAQAGDNAFCDILVDNLGPSDARSVTLTDQIIASKPFSVASAVASPSGSCSIAGSGTSWTVSCNLATEAAGGRTTVKVTFTASGTTDVNDTASVTSATTDPNSANNSATGKVHFISTADVGITKSVLPTSVNAGSPVTYTLTVSNAGPSKALSVVAQDVLPSALSIVSITPTVGSCTAGVPGNAAQPTTCTLGDLTNGASATITVVAKVAATTPDGTILLNQATVSTSSDDLNNANNSASATLTVTTSADLALAKTALGSPVAGTTISYRYDVSNAGPSVARTVSLHDALPAQMTFVSAFRAAGNVSVGLPLACALIAQGTNTWSCPLGDIAPTGGTPQQFIVNVFIASSVANGTALTNNATLVSATADPNGANNSASATVNVTRSADLSIALTSDADTYKPSSTVKYTVAVKNNGPSDALPFVVKFDLPQTKQAVYQFDTGGCTKTGQTLTCNFGALGTGQTASINVYVTIRGSKGQVEAGVNISSAGTFDPVPTNNAATRTVLIKGGL